MLRHTYFPRGCHIQNLKYLLLMAAEIQPGQDFKVQGHRVKVKVQNGQENKKKKYCCTPTLHGDDTCKTSSLMFKFKVTGSSSKVKLEIKTC